jgi:flagellar protein FliO/FliZ
MDLLATAVRMTFGLAVVLGVMWLIARASRKPLKARAGGAVAVLARQQLSRGSSVAVVRIADRAFVVGVTETQVSLLAETDLTAVTAALAPAETISRTPVELTDTTEVPATDRDLAAITELDSRRSRGAIAGSALSPATWKQAVEVLRERTARRA